MAERHKHADLIIAWANGAKIQYRDPDYSDGEWDETTHPTWSEYKEYRIKPKTMKYRVALLTALDEPCVAATHDSKAAQEWERHENFVRWLTDWVEVKV